MSYYHTEFKEVDVQKYVATALPVHVGVRLPEWKLGNMSVEVMREYLMDDLLVGIECAVASMDGKTTTDTRTERSESERMQVPATWLDHVKRDLFPEWLKKFFPPKFETVVVTSIKHITQITRTTHVCPHTSMDNKKHMMFMVHGK